MPFLVDSHAHLDFADYDTDRDAVLERARQAGLKWIVSIGAGAGIESGRRSLLLSREILMVYSTAGIHPHDAKIWSSEIADEIIRLAKEPKQVAIGEIGLDFAKEYSPREMQETAFREQLKIANELDLPVIIHSRNAHRETLRIIKDLKPKRGVMHCFSGSLELARQMVKLGFYISIPGVITFKNARTLIEVAQGIPLDRLLVETDCPFLTPEPFRGKRNEPAYVKYVAEKIAQIKSIPFEQVAEQTASNAELLFSLREKTGLI